MLKSCVKQKNGHPCLFIDGESVAPIAYTTYFEERSCYEDFIGVGYRIFFVNLSFNTLPINNATGFSPFRVGVFDAPKHPDYSEFEDVVKKILAKCPKAIIFPRVNISMPKWWCESHPSDTVITSSGKREALFSENFRKDASEMLAQAVKHIKNAEYAHRIGGWQICGGTTQEFFHHDRNGSLGSCAEEPYRLWVKKNYGVDNASLPSHTDFVYSDKSVQNVENARRFSLFSDLSVAKTIDVFAEIVKKETDFEQVVGAFYGYAFESCNTVLCGTHGLRALLDSPNLDFFSSPNAYTNNRAFGIDWADMLPTESVKLHGKLCFIECDVRTYLTSSVQEARPGEYPDHIYKTKSGESVWSGPPTAALSCAALRKSFAHQAARASAVWWFDMWGGWYDDPALMTELKKMKMIYDNGFSNDSPLSAEVVFFADEQGYSNLLGDSPQLRGIGNTRTAMGNTGAPYDIFMVEDAPKILKDYKAAIFPFPVPSEAGKTAIELCGKLGVPCLCATAEKYEFTTDEIREFLRSSDVHIYTEENDVVYAGNGYFGLHSAVGGEKALKLPKQVHVSPVFGTDVLDQVTDTVVFTLEENGTALFSVSD